MHLPHALLVLRHVLGWIQTQHVHLSLLIGSPSKIWQRGSKKRQMCKLRKKSMSFWRKTVAWTNCCRHDINRLGERREPSQVFSASCNDWNFQLSSWQDKTEDIQVHVKMWDIDIWALSCQFPESLSIAMCFFVLDTFSQLQHFYKFLRKESYTIHFYSWRVTQIIPTHFWCLVARSFSVVTDWSW